jgi:hypothetical protein
MREIVGPVRQEHQDRGPPDRSDQRAKPTEHDTGEQGQRELQREGTGVRELQHDRQQATPESGATRADDERQRLRATDAQPAQRRGDLVVAHGPQRAPQATVDQVVEHEQNDQRAGAGDPGLPAFEREARAEPRRRDRRIDDQPVLAPERRGKLVGQRGQPDRERERGAGQIRPAQTARRGADRNPDQRRHHRGGNERRDQCPVLVADQQRHRIRTDRHQGPMAERDLPAETHEHGQAREHREVVRAVRELEVVVGAQEFAEQPQHDAARDDQAQRSQQRHPTQPSAESERPHTRRSRVAENSPVGRTSSTSTRITSAASGTSADPS